MPILQERAILTTVGGIRASLSSRFIGRACRNLPRQEACCCLGYDFVVPFVVGFRRRKSPHERIVAVVVADMSLKSQMSFWHHSLTSFVHYFGCCSPGGVASCGLEMVPASPPRRHLKRLDSRSKTTFQSTMTQKTFHLRSLSRLTA